MKNIPSVYYTFFYLVDEIRTLLLHPLVRQMWGHNRCLPASCGFLVAVEEQDLRIDGHLRHLMVKGDRGLRWWLVCGEDIANNLVRFLVLLMIILSISCDLVLYVIFFNFCIDWNSPSLYGKYVISNFSIYNIVILNFPFIKSRTLFEISLHALRTILVNNVSISSFANSVFINLVIVFLY